MFELKVRRKALRYIDRLDAKRKRAIKEALSLLKSDPVPARRVDAIKLKGYDDIYRIRIVYQVLWSERMIIIIFVGPRGRAY